MDIEKIKAEFLEMVKEQSQRPTLLQEIASCPTFAKLESSFKSPEMDENGYANRILPAVWDSVSLKEDGCTIDNGQLGVSSRLYSQYVDEPSLLVDECHHRLLLFVPDEKISAVAFKGGCWSEALKLKASAAETMTLIEAFEKLNKQQ